MFTGMQRLIDHIVTGLIFHHSASSFLLRRATPFPGLMDLAPPFTSLDGILSL